MSILISQANVPTAIVVEVWGGKVRVREPREGDDIIGNANHPTTDACRYLRARKPAGEPMCVASREIGLPLNVERMQQVLAHPKVLQPNLNLVSMIFDPTMNRMFLSCGRSAAAQGTFMEHQLFPD